MKAYIFSILLTLIFIVSLSSTKAQGNSKYFTDSNGVAINGYDLVSYFTDYKPIKGSAKYSIVYNKTTFYFANNEHLKMFKANPKSFIPQFGGYCAFAMGMKGAKVPADPKTFKIVDGKLYLYFNDIYNGKKFNTIIPWNKDEARLRKQAEINYSKK